jgi:hypothetical protein
MHDLMLLERPSRTTPGVLGLVPTEVSMARAARVWLIMAQPALLPAAGTARRSV